MELPREQPPAYSHDPKTLEFPPVPRHDPSAATNGFHLPELASLGLLDSRARDQGPAAAQRSRRQSTSQPWHSPISLQSRSFPAVPSGPLRNASDVGSASPNDAESLMSYEEAANRPPTAASRDDPDVLMAAEALSDLGNPDLAPSPSHRSATLPPFSPPHGAQTAQRSSAQESEPLFTMFVSAHPWLGNTINGSLNAYSVTKSYSPRFVQAGANFVERNIGSPVANTVSAVGRKTGVEHGIRRYLGARRRESDIERGPTEDFGQANGHKRRRVEDKDEDAMDIEQEASEPLLRSLRPRNSSQESVATLPVYDSNRSPPYDEMSNLAMVDLEESQGASRSQSHWSTQVMTVTAALGVALSEQARNSLKTCLQFLKGAIRHVEIAIRTLRNLLEQYQRSTNPESANQANGHSGKTDYSSPEEAARDLASRVKAFEDDLRNTLKSFIQNVTRYANGALPENAANLVRRQIITLPQRFGEAQRASNQETQSEPQAVRVAHRGLAQAREVLDAMTQVALIIQTTVGKAEQWLDSFGRRRREESRPFDEKFPLSES